MDPTKPFFGIDYGNKYSGNTVICYKYDDQTGFAETEKDQDADSAIVGLAQKMKPEYIFLDAPLSLPKVYFNPSDEEQDYFYRKCDRDLHAMSPMFIGGLTARAIRLKNELENLGYIVKEVYPAALANLIKLKEYGYKENPINIVRCMDMLSSLCDFQGIPAEKVHTWHHFDALLALISGGRYLQGNAIRYGNGGEGIIHI